MAGAGTRDEAGPRACAGCLGTEQCWICTGEGCGRCASSGRCHLCQADRVVQLIPRQPEGAAGERTVCAG